MTDRRNVRVTILACMLIIIGCSWQALVPTRDPPPTTALSDRRPKVTLTPSPVRPSPAPASPTPTSAPPQTKLGVHLLLDDGRNAWPEDIWAEHLRYARRAVGEWGYVTELIREDDIDIARWQRFMDLCADLHLTPVLRLATTYDTARNWWNAPAPDVDGGYASIAGRYAAFVAGLDWPADAHYVIVGNEPNHGNEWSGKPDPAAYGRFLIAVADAIHSADPGAKVLNAGLDPYTPNTNSVPFVDGLLYVDEETFLDEMVKANPDVLSRLDLWASHAYPTGPLTQGPWDQVFKIDMINGATNPDHVSPPPEIPNRGINGYEWELFKLSTYGVSHLGVMITETGWRHAETSDPNAADNAPLPLPDAATVAAYLDLALRGNHGRFPAYPEQGWTPWLNDPRVVAITPFALDGNPAEWGHTNWIALDHRGAVLATYAPLDVLTTGRPRP